MERLIGMHHEHERARRLPAPLEAAWLHHRFVQIHLIRRRERTHGAAAHEPCLRHARRADTGNHRAGEAEVLRCPAGNGLLHRTFKASNFRNYTRGRNVTPRAETSAMTLDTIFGSESAEYRKTGMQVPSSFRAERVKKPETPRPTASNARVWQKGYPSSVSLTSCGWCTSCPRRSAVSPE